MTPRTQNLLRNTSNLLARGGGAVSGLSIVFLALSDPINWIWLRGIGLGAGAALLGVVVIRYIPYGPPTPEEDPTRAKAQPFAADFEDFEGPDWRLLAWPIGGFIAGFAIMGAFVLYLILR